MRRIVVTGLGAVTPLAAGVEASWSRLLAGRSGIRRLPDDVVRDLPAKVGGAVPSLKEDPDAGLSGYRPGAEGSAQGRPVHPLCAGGGRRGAYAGEMEACLGNGSPAHTHDHRFRDRRFPSHYRSSAHSRSARCPPPVAVYDTVLPGESRGGPHLDPSWVQRAAGRAGDSVRGRHSGDRRCGSSYPRQ